MMPWFKSTSNQAHASSSSNSNPPHDNTPGADIASGTSLAVTAGPPDQPSDPGKEEVLLTIPGAIVHLIDGQESIHLATGPLSVLRLVQSDGKGIAVFIKVGDDLQWPLTRDMPTTKLDPFHYSFALKVLPEVDQELAKEEDHPTLHSRTGEDRDSATLNYGVSFPSTDSASQALLTELDKLLQQYSTFSSPQVVQGAPETEAGPSNGQPQEKKQSKGTLVRLEEFFFGKPNVPSAAKGTDLADVKRGAVPVALGSLPPSDERRKLAEARSAAYWTALAPNVEEYNSIMAKGIATQSNTLFKGLFWCSEATIEQLERLGDYAKAHIKRKDKPTEISPRTLRNLRRVKKMSKMTERVAKGVLAGIVTATGIASGSVMRSKAGKKFFSMLPGEVALVSLDAFGKVFDAVELAGRSVLHSTRVVASGVVAHRYGEQAGEAASESFATAGHVFSTVWTVSKIRKVLNPNKGGPKVSKSALLKSAIKGKGPGT